MVYEPIGASSSLIRAFVMGIQIRGNDVKVDLTDEFSSICLVVQGLDIKTT